LCAVAPFGMDDIGPSGQERAVVSGGHRSLFAPIGIFLALSGSALIAVAMTHEGAPQPPATAAGSIDTPSSPAVITSSTIVEQTLPRSKPVELDIPSIAVHSSLLSLGVNDDGTIEVPSGTSYDEAGWYKFSPTPGSLGPAIILGHVDSGARGASVFFELGHLRPGNRVMVTRLDRSVAVFEITGVRRYAKVRFPTRLVYGNTDHAALRLITCGGSFDYSTGHYVDNVVVFATLVDQAPGQHLRAA
jgi:sortase (surface protein transpeptidase)